MIACVHICFPVGIISSSHGFSLVSAVVCNRTCSAISQIKRHQYKKAKPFKTPKENQGRREGEDERC